MKLRKALAFLLAVLFLCPVPAGAETSVRWLYSFSAGEVLSGKGMDDVREFLDAVQLSLTSQEEAGGSAGQAELISYGKPVFTLIGRLSAGGEVGLYCSLTGNCTLMCRRDQVQDFLGTVVRMLAERSILKEDGLLQAERLSARAGDYLIRIMENDPSRDLQVGINPNALLDQISLLTPEAESLPLDAGNAECPGAVIRRTWQLSEAELNSLAELGIEKIRGIPVLSDAFAQGTLRIGDQAVTEDFLRKLFASMHGETVLQAFQDPEGQVLLLRLITPETDLLADDPVFGRSRGLEFSVTRSGSAEEGHQESLTVFRLIGVDGSVLSVRMEKGPGSDIPSLPDRKVYQVGEMDSDQLWDLIRSLGLTIASNALNLIMDLPRVVFDTLVNKLF